MKEINAPKNSATEEATVKMHFQFNFFSCNLPWNVVQTQNT
jgi:hypothetical protein